ncbi:MAG: hypothetical protein KDA94_11045 [Acidimicrobiales bacterium]|nr:hypothetical protein [Acidimicrobiales bacterium]
MARRFAELHGLSDDDVIIDRSQLEAIQGALYCLQAAIEDVDQDLEGSPSAREVHDALRWLLDNARPAAGLWIEPKAVSDAPLRLPSLDIT